MTIIAGIQCLDGLLMCADSEQVFDECDDKYQARKVALFNSAHAHIAIGGAGDYELIECVHYQLGQKLNSDCPDWNDAESWLQSFAEEMWKRYVVEPHRGLAADLVPSASFLVGLQMSGECGLFKWERNEIRRVKSHTSVGIGGLQGEPLLNALRFRFAAREMLLYAVRVMFRVKQLVQGCGGKTEILLLNNNGLAHPFATIHIDALEHLIEEVDRFLLQHPLRFVSGQVHLDEYRDLDTQAEQLKQFKNRFQEIFCEAMPPNFSVAPPPQN